MSRRPLPRGVVKASTLKSAVGVSNVEFKWSAMSGKIPGVPLEPTVAPTSLAGVRAVSLNSSNAITAASIVSNTQQFDFQGEFPPRMYANTSVFTPSNISAYSNITRFMNPIMYGTYTISTSPGGKNAYFACDANLNTYFESTKYAYSMDSNTYGQYIGNANTLCYTSPVSKTSSNIRGEWIEFGLPSNVAVNLISMRPMLNQGWAPNSFAVCGGSLDSKSNMAWYLLYTTSNIVWRANNETGFAFNGNTNYAYKYWRIICTANSNNPAIGDVSRFALCDIRLCRYDKFVGFPWMTMNIASTQLGWVTLYTSRATVTCSNLITGSNTVVNVQSMGACTVSNLEEMTPYTFTVQGYNSAYVPGASFTLTGTTVTPNLTSFTAAITGASNVTLRAIGTYCNVLVSWSNDSNTSYGTCNIVNPSVISNPSHNYTTVITGLLPSTKYTFTATPYSPKGFAGSNRNLVVTTSRPTLSGPIVTTNATYWPTDKSVTVNATQTWCETINIAYSNNGVSSNITLSNPIFGANYVTISNLTPPGGRFTFTVRGFVGSNLIGACNNTTGNITTYLPTIHNFNAVAQYSSNVVLGWTPLCCDYTVITLNNSNISGNLGSNVRTFTYSNIEPNTSYTFNITPYTNLGYTACNSTLVVNSTPAVLDVFTTGVTPTSTVVNWNAKFVDYVIVSWSNNGLGSNSPAVFAPTSNYTVSNLTSNALGALYTVTGYTGTSNLVGSVTTSNVIPLNGLVGWYDGDSFGLSGTSNWFNKVPGGSNITNVDSNVKKATSNWPYVYGSASDRIVFPTNQMTSNYSLFYVGRVPGSNLNAWLVDNTGTASTLNGWYSGWVLNNPAGTCIRSNNQAFQTNAGIYVAPVPSASLHGSNWIIGCDINQPCLFRTNGVTRSYSNLPVYQVNPFTLAINTKTTRSNNFQAAEFVIYDRTLNMDEIYAVEGYLRNKYYPPVLQSLSASVVGTTVTLNWDVAPSNCDYLNISMNGVNVASNLSKSLVSYTVSNVPLDTDVTFTVSPFMNSGFCLSNYDITVNTS